MSAVVVPAPHRALPSRKPLPIVHPSTGIVEQDSIYTRRDTHSHSRSTSGGQNYPIPPAAHYMPQLTSVNAGTRRTLSNATSSTASSGMGHVPVPLSRPPTNISSGSSIRRSTSSRSSVPPTSYVALLRRQKATVWCDRAQHEDPRLLAQQRQAKMRANMEVVGGGNNSMRGSVSTGGVRSKIRHGGAVKASAVQFGNMSGAGVPMRLSASEVDDGDSDDDRLRGTIYQQPDGSGRSSLSSSHRASLPALGPHSTQGRHSSTSTPPSRDSDSPSIRNESMLQNPDETPVPGTYQGRDYFDQPAHDGNPTSGGSGSSDERNFGDMTSLPVRSEDDRRKTTAEDLRRRGSVDDRTMNLSSVRLFVANPDLSD